MKWLQLTERKSLIRTLFESKIYRKGIDYISIKIGSYSDRGGNNKLTILLTVRTFKKICIKTKSQYSEKIIDYYLALEELVIQYQKYIVSILIEENKLLKNDLNSEIFPKGGLIYILDLEFGYYKIGKTADLQARKAIYDTGSIHKHKVIFWFESENMNVLENCIKSILKPFAIKKNKEVYRVNLEKIISIIKGCSGLIGNMTCSTCPNHVTIEKNDIDEHYEKYHNKIYNKSALLSFIDHNQLGGSNDDESDTDEYYCKYVKYKHKYLCLKYNINYM